MQLFVTNGCLLAADTLEGSLQCCMACDLCLVCCLHMAVCYCLLFHCIFFCNTPSPPHPPQPLFPTHPQPAPFTLHSCLSYCATCITQADATVTACQLRVGDGKLWKLSDPFGICFQQSARVPDAVTDAMKSSKAQQRKQQRQEVNKAKQEARKRRQEGQLSDDP